MGESYLFERVEVFTTGAVGRPGRRTFFLQARTESQTVTLKCEKQQVAALARYFETMLADLAAPEAVPHPAVLDLAQPIEPAWVAGSIGVAYDPASDRIVVAVEELVPTDEHGEPLEEAAEDAGALRIMLTRGQVAGFVQRADEAVAAGRPSCRWCGRPIDPDGHPCPRMN
jgi:uncharacterized repeat protein (TIGR03847 family)